MNDKAKLLTKPAMFDIELACTRMLRSHPCKINKHAGRFSSSFLLKALSVNTTCGLLKCHINPARQNKPLIHQNESYGHVFLPVYMIRLLWGYYTLQLLVAIIKTDIFTTNWTRTNLAPGHILAPVWTQICAEWWLHPAEYCDKYAIWNVCKGTFSAFPSKPGKNKMWCNLWNRTVSSFQESQVGT